MSERIQTRNHAVLTAALALAEEKGWHALTRDAVAERAEVSAGSVNNAFGTIGHLRDAVMAMAIKCQILPIIAAGLAAKHPAAVAASDDLKRRALALLAA